MPEYEWEEVLASDQWKNGKFIKRNRIRKRYYEQVMLPQAIALNKDVNRVKDNFYAATYKDLGIGEKSGFTFPKSTVFQDDGQLPEFDKAALKAVKAFQSLGLNTKAPGFAGLIQTGIGGIFPALGSIPGVSKIATGIGEGFEKARRPPIVDDRIKYANVLNNFIQGGAKAAIYAPEFFAHMASDPINGTAGLMQVGIEVSAKSVGALSYVTGLVLGYDKNRDSMKRFRKDFEDILTRPEEPVMTFMMATGMVRGAGKLKGLGAADLIHRAGELKPAEVSLPTGKFTPNLNVASQGIKSITPKEMAARLKDIDSNVAKFMNDNIPLPENYADGVLIRSAERIGFNPEAVVTKAKTSGNLSRGALELRDEFSAQADRIARQQFKDTEGFLLERQRGLDAFENKAQKQIDEISSISAKNIGEFLNRNIVDNAGNVKSALRRLGLYGSQAAMMHDLNRGSSSEAIRRFIEASDEVFSGLKIGEQLDLGKHIDSKRTQEIDLFRLAKEDKTKAEIRVNDMQTAEIMEQLRQARDTKKHLPRHLVERETVSSVNIRSAANLTRALKRAKLKVSALKRQLRKAEKIESSELPTIRAELDAAGVRVAEIKGQLEYAKKGITTTTKGAPRSERIEAGRKVKLLEDSLKLKRKKSIELGIRLKKIPIDHPGGYRGFDHTIKIRRRKYQWGDEKFDRILQATNTFHKIMNKNLALLLENGLIDKPTFRELETFARYKPRKFLEHEVFNPLTVEVKSAFGKKSSVSSTGVESLDQGSVGVLINDPKWLLWKSISQVEGRIGNNRAATALLDFAENNPHNGIVKVKPKNSETPNGQTSISAIRKGKRVEMLMDNVNAAEWIGIPPAMTPTLAAALRHGSGTSILKAMATGINPEFFITNIPRDIGLIYLSTAGREAPRGRVYSSTITTYLKEIATDMIEVFPDMIKNKGAAIDYIREGGGMEFLSDQGRMLKMDTRTRNSPTRLKIHNTAEALQQVLSYTGKRSEMWTRLAIRHRAIKEGFSTINATHLARNYLDFNQSGSLAKGADTFVPYLNASIQATRGILREARDNPGRFSYKLGNIVALSTSLYMMNSTLNKEVYDAIDDEDKANNFIVALPKFMGRKDINGDMRYKYFRFAKDQGQRAIAGVAEAAAARLYEGKMPSKVLLKSIGDLSPVGGSTLFPPTAQAWLALHHNHDTWFNDDVWGGRDVDAELRVSKNTPKPVEGFAKLLGLSPVAFHRSLQKMTTYRNTIADAGMMGYTVLMQNLPEEEQKEFNAKLFVDLPFVRRLMGETNPRRKLRKRLDVLNREENSRILRQNNRLKEIVDTGVRDDIIHYIRSVPAEDQNRLGARWDRQVAIDSLNLPSRYITLSFQPAAIRASEFYREWAALDRAGRKDLVDMVRKVPGFITKKFNRIFEEYILDGEKLKETK